MTEKEYPIYYQKLVCKLSECKTGDWVYNSDAELCYVEAPEDRGGSSSFYGLHYDCMESGCCGDTVVYPLTLRTRQLADKMAALRLRYYKANIMNSYFSHELEEEFHALMLISDTAEDAQKQYDEFWQRLNDRFSELLEYADKLHIQPRRL
ncbi:MAG: hypothetical protein IJ615_11280 [Bacteroidaceae bacterium]|nr:hypothetical protein [Bacteroidaceae bacterium]